MSLARLALVFSASDFPEKLACVPLKVIFLKVDVCFLPYVYVKGKWVHLLFLKSSVRLLREWWLEETNFLRM